MKPARSRVEREPRLGFLRGQQRRGLAVSQPSARLCQALTGSETKEGVFDMKLHAVLSTRAICPARITPPVRIEQAARDVGGATASANRPTEADDRSSARDLAIRR